MYTGRTLPELAEELKRQASVKEDFKAPTNLLQLSVRQTKDRLETPKEVLFRVGDKFEGQPTELMHDQIGKYCGIPAAYYDRMRDQSPQLLATNVNTWLHAERETRLIRTLDGKARAFLSSRYRTIDNIDIAEAVLPVLIEESKKLGAIEVVSTQVTENRLYIKAVSKRLTYEVKKGDVVQLGMTISNSEVGKGSVSVLPFLLRLVCLNGATIEDSGVRKFHLGRQSADLEAAEKVFRDETRAADDRAFVMKLQDIVRAAFNDENFEKLKGITVDATTRKVSAPVPEVVEVITNKFGLSESHKNSFLTNLIEGGDLTQWGVANAVTAIANKAEDYETATDLEKAGGSIMVLDKAGWSMLMEEATA